MIWLKRILLGFAAIVIWIALTALFLSKERLCNMAIETASEKAGVSLCYTGRDASMLGCSMKQITLLYGCSPVAKIQKAALYPWRVEAAGIRVEGLAADMIPPAIESILFEPLSGKISSRGDFGVLSGRVSWGSRTLTLELLPSSLMKRKFSQTLRLFKKRNGKYIYALSF